jgi:hypothetical protein
MIRRKFHTATLESLCTIVTLDDKINIVVQNFNLNSYFFILKSDSEIMNSVFKHNKNRA